MEIENNRIAPVVTHSGGQGAPVADERTGGSTPAADPSGAGRNSADQLSLTGEARQLQQAEKQLAAAPLVDAKRVEAVRTAVENGTFTVNPERIAAKLMSLEQVLTDAR